MTKTAEGSEYDDRDDDFDKTEAELLAEAVEQIVDELPAFNVEASWQEYDDAIEFRFELGDAKIEVTVPDTEPGNAQILVSSLQSLFQQTLHAYMEAGLDEDEDEGEGEDV